MSATESTLSLGVVTFDNISSNCLQRNSNSTLYNARTFPHFQSSPWHANVMHPYINNTTQPHTNHRSLVAHGVTPVICPHPLNRLHNAMIHTQSINSATNLHLLFGLSCGLVTHPTSLIPLAKLNVSASSPRSHCIRPPVPAILLRRRDHLCLTLSLFTETNNYYTSPSGTPIHTHIGSVPQVPRKAGLSVADAHVIDHASCQPARG